MRKARALGRREAVTLFGSVAAIVLPGKLILAQNRPAVARCIAVTGTVQIVRGPGRETLAVGGPIFEGDVIVTREASKVRVVYFNGPIVTLGPNSESHVARVAANSRIGVQALFRLANGIIRLVGGAVSGPTEITVETPGALAAVRSTDWLVQLADAGTAVFVADGQVTVRGKAGGSVTLPGGRRHGRCGRVSRWNPALGARHGVMRPWPSRPFKLDRAAGAAGSRWWWRRPAGSRLPVRDAAVRWRARLLIGTLAAAAGWATLLGGDPDGFAGRVENATLDLRFRLRGSMEPGPEIVIVAIDDRTVELAGGWPLSRPTLATLVHGIDRASPALVVVNLLLSGDGNALPERARALLEKLRSALPDKGTIVRAEIDVVLGDRNADRPLAHTFRTSGRVLLPFALMPAAVGRLDDPPPWLERTALAAVHPERKGAERSNGDTWLLLPTAELGAAAASLGHVNVLLDPDGILRHHVPALSHAGTHHPSLAVEATRLASGLPREAVAFLPGELLAIGSLTVPLDWRSRQVVNHYGPAGTFRTLSAADILQGAVPAHALAGPDRASRCHGRGRRRLAHHALHPTPARDRAPGNRDRQRPSWPRDHPHDGNAGA